MYNPWMTYMIKKQKNRINFRLILLFLYQKFDPIYYKGRVEIVEQPENNRILIQTSGNVEADVVLKFLNKKQIIWN